MNLQDLPRKINAADQLVVCFDVSKERLDGYPIHVRRGAVDREITVSIDRKTDQIEEQLDGLAMYADRYDLDGLCVVCEPTGGYDEELVRLALSRATRPLTSTPSIPQRCRPLSPGTPARRTRRTPGQWR